jgi:hypothetical protein
MKYQAWFGLLWAAMATLIEQYYQLFIIPCALFQSLCLLICFHQACAGILTALGFASMFSGFEKPCQYLTHPLQQLIRWVWPFSAFIICLGLLGWDTTRIKLDIMLFSVFFFSASIAGIGIKKSKPLSSCFS